MDLIYNALSNIMMCDKDYIQIHEIQLKEDCDGYFHLFLQLLDTEYEYTNYHINISLFKNCNAMKIDNIYILAILNKNTKITPYYYEGLNLLKDCLLNMLENISFYYDEVKQYEK